MLYSYSTVLMLYSYSTVLILYSTHTLLYSYSTVLILSITQVISDVFQVPVFAAEQPDSASLGAAYRAMHGLACKNSGSYVSYPEVVGDLAASYSLVAEPNTAAAPVYDDLVTKFAAAEAKVVASA
jgi:xylulokinase